jgi:hypothetical protein
LIERTSPSWSTWSTKLFRIRKAEVNTKSCQYQPANKTPNNELRENSLYIPADQYNITADHYDMANLENLTKYELFFFLFFFVFGQNIYA